MNTLVCWNNGTQMSFYQVPTQLVLPYFHVQGTCIDKGHMDDQTHRTIEHLGIMLGEHDHAADTIPTLTDFLEQKRGEAPKRRKNRREKIIDSPWRQFMVPANMELNNCERLLHTGWLDEVTTNREIIEAHANANTEEVGVGAGGDGRGEVKDPATDKRLKEHGGGTRGKQPQGGRNQKNKKR